MNRTRVLRYLLQVLLLFALLKENRWLNNLVKRERQYGYRMKTYLTFYDHWISLGGREYRIEEYFRTHRINKIALYGYGVLGARLYEFLKKSDIVEYIIDRNAEEIEIGVKAINPDGIIPPVDMIVVTPITDYEMIYNGLKEKCSCPIISVEDIVS